MYYYYLLEGLQKDMSDTNGKSGLFIGLNRGMVVPLAKNQSYKKRPVLRKGKISKRSAGIRELIREIAGLAPFEKRMVELIRTGVQSKEKRAVKLARAKLGTQRRAQKKRDELVSMITVQSRAAKK